MENYFGGKIGIRTFLIFVVSIIVFAVIFNCKTLVFDLKEGEYTFYTYSKSTNANILTVPSTSAEKTKNKLTNIKGESINLCFDRVERQKALDFSQEFLREKEAILVKSERGEWGESLYYYSKNISGGVKIDGVIVNIHIVKNDRQIIMGSPLIFGSF